MAFSTRSRPRRVAWRGINTRAPSQDFTSWARVSVEWSVSELPACHLPRPALCKPATWIKYNCKLPSNKRVHRTTHTHRGRSPQNRVRCAGAGNCPITTQRLLGGGIREYQSWGIGWWTQWLASTSRPIWHGPLNPPSRSSDLCWDRS